jgi:hypothetical protein
MSAEVFIVIDDSTPKTITGIYQFDSESGGKLVMPSGTEFPTSPEAGECFWRTDERKLYRRNNGNTGWDAVLAEMPTVPVLVQEMHLVTSGEEAQGYFILGGVPIDANMVLMVAHRGSMQVNKILVGSTGAVPDFEIRNGDECHINNSGGATGLSGDIVTGWVLQMTYTIAASL